MKEYAFYGWRLRYERLKKSLAAAKTTEVLEK